MALAMLSPTVKYGLEGNPVKNLINMPSHNLMAFSCVSDAKIRLFKNDDPVVVFEPHCDPGHCVRHVDMVHLSQDVLCSVDNVGNVYTWRASCGHVLGRLEGLKVCSSTLVKQNDAQV